MLMTMFGKLLYSPMHFAISQMLASARVKALLLFALTCIYLAASETALDRYVHAPDSHYRYDLVKTIPGNGFTTYVIDLTSQQYLTAKEVNHPLWKHSLTVVKPTKVTTDIALIFIQGGDNTDPLGSVDPLAPEIATASGAVVATLSDVPNQPLIFADETRERSEDAIIAYTWDKFLRTSDPKWPLRLPMTKAAVRAMDTVTDFLHSSAVGNVKVDRFVVCGESKRGWTTWTTAAEDKRVIAIIPEVIDVLNTGPSLRHQSRVYGKFSSELDDYAQAGIMTRVNTPEYRNLMKIEEPYEYRDRFTMPKLIINASGDQYFLPDSSQFYFDELPGEKHLRYVPDADHGVRDHSDVGETIAAFFGSVVTGAKRPEFDWHFRSDGELNVDTKTEPAHVKLWQATNPKARDFRLAAIGPAYKSSDVEPSSPGHYIVHIKKPARGYTAYFVELTYPSGAKYPFKFTTAVKVIPDIEPFAWLDAGTQRRTQ